MVKQNSFHHEAPVSFAHIGILTGIYQASITERKSVPFFLRQILFCYHLLEPKLWVFIWKIWKHDDLLRTGMRDQEVTMAWNPFHGNLRMESDYDPRKFMTHCSREGVTASSLRDEHLVQWLRCHLRDTCVPYQSAWVQILALLQIPASW